MTPTLCGRGVSVLWWVILSVCVLLLTLRCVTAGGSPAPLVDSDSYLLMSPGPESSPDRGVFSPRPGGAAAPPGSHFEFPPAPQLARESPPPSGFCNPSYHEVGKGRVPSTPKMGTRVSRPARSAAGAAADWEEQQRQQSAPSESSPPDGDGGARLSSGEASAVQFRLPVPVGCEQLV